MWRMVSWNRVSDCRRRVNGTKRRHGHAPMKKNKKSKTDREVLQELFPKPIVEEVDAILREVDNPPKNRRSNPTGKKAPKPWGRKWVEERKRETE